MSFSDTSAMGGIDPLAGLEFFTIPLAGAYGCRSWSNLNCAGNSDEGSNYQELHWRLFNILIMNGTINMA